MTQTHARTQLSPVYIYEKLIHTNYTLLQITHCKNSSISVHLQRICIKL